MGADILLLDEERSRSARLRRELERRGMRATSARSALDALRILGEREIAAVVVATVADANPIDVCRRISTGTSAVPVVLLAQDSSVNQAVEALRAGASDYATEPLDVAVVGNLVERAVERRALRVHLKELRSRAPSDDDSTTGRLIGTSPAIEAVRAKMEILAKSESPVLVTGESGTGKGLFARALHDGSQRRDGPFVAIDAAALPEHLVESELFGHSRGAFTGAAAARSGLLVRADGGTVFLDEVTGMPLGTQAKLLRALQEKTVRPLGDSKEIPFDARVIAATNANIDACVAAGTFRGDLFFRINVLAVHLPPLKQRGHDVLLLAQHFIERFSLATQKRVVGLTPGAARVLLAREWPGNVRELANCIEAAVVNARYDHLTESDLSVEAPTAPTAVQPVPLVPPASPSATTLESVEMGHIHHVLESVGGNRSRAAKILGLDRKTLARRLKRASAVDGVARPTGAVSGRGTRG